MHPPESIVQAMHQQVSAERKKRADVLESEGKRLAAINVAQGMRESMILESEASRLKIINCAEGNFLPYFKYRYLIKFELQVKRKL